MEEGSPDTIRVGIRVGNPCVGVKTLGYDMGLSLQGNGFYLHAGVYGCIVIHPEGDDDYWSRYPRPTFTMQTATW